MKSYIPSREFRFFIRNAGKASLAPQSDICLPSDHDVLLAEDRAAKYRGKYYWRVREDVTTSGQNRPIYELFK